MAVITYDGIPARGNPLTATLNKTDLASISSVSNDAYFSDSSNWESVVIRYDSTTSNQHKVVKFDATLVSPTSIFEASSRSRGDFEVTSVMIRDFDGDYFQVLRDELNTSEFDVLFT
jgi:hypothetical protein